MGILSREREVATRGDGWTLAARGAPATLWAPGGGGGGPGLGGIGWGP